MKKTYNQVGLTARLRQLGFAALLVGSASAVHAQALPYSPANVVKAIGTYTDISTVAGSAVIATTSTDDANSAATPIGFTFRFNSTNFTDFVLNTNGFIKMGTVAPAGPSFNDGGGTITGGPVDGPDLNLVMPFNADLLAGTAGGTEYRVLTTGTSPNRICTIQWKNVKDKARNGIGTQYNNFSFQAKLYEAGSQIDFVYGPVTAGPLANDAPKFVNVGLKGSGNVGNQLILGAKSSANPWANVTFANGPYATIAFDVRVTELPELGRTYSFTVPVPQDAAVQVIYGYNKLLVPGGQPATIRANVRNAGTGALGATTVTLSITGANTYTATQNVAGLAVGANAVVSFANVPVPVAGNNTVTVSVGNDGNNANNSVAMLMVTNASTTSFITPNTGAASAFGFTAGASDLYFGAKVTITQPQDVVGVNAFLFNDAAAVGSTAYGVAVDATSGALLTRSPDFVITAASLNSLHTFTFSSPTTVPTGDVIVGLATVAAAGATQFFLMGVQSEVPSRANTFYTGSAVTAGAPNPSLTAGNALYKYMLEAIFSPPATCATPNTIVVSNVTQTGAQVSFNGPNNGTGYQVVYVPSGTTPTASSPSISGTTSPIIIPAGTLTAGTGYDIYVRALCGATDRSGLAGPTFFSTPCTPPIINNFPYAQNFDVIANGQDLPCGIKVEDTNTDGNTWEIRNSVTSGVNQIPVARSQPFAMVYITNADGITAADDWFYLPAMRFTAGSIHRLSFYYRNNSRPGLLDESLEVKYGLAATPAGQTTLLYSNPAIATGPVVVGGSQSYTLANNNTTPAVADITTPATGLYYIGFHANSQSDRGFLAVDDINISIGLLATSSALTRAVSVYPNPSNTGNFKLDIAGANANGLMQVEVTNMLGQRVYSSTVKDNFSNELNLSNLATGIYSLKVKNGSEYMQQQISIVK